MLRYTLQQRTEAKELKSWQCFLFGQGLVQASTDGGFGVLAEETIASFKQPRGLTSYGIVSSQTFSMALMMGFHASFTGCVVIITHLALASLSDLIRATVKSWEFLYVALRYKTASILRNPECISVLEYRLNDMIQLS